MDKNKLFIENIKVEEYLWSEKYNEAEDEARYEENPFPNDLFYSFYYYSDMVLKTSLKTIEDLTHCDIPEIKEKAETLAILIKN